MTVLRRLGAAIWKMFVGDWLLTGGAVASVGLCAGLLRWGLISKADAPFLLAALALAVTAGSISLAVSKLHPERSNT